MALDNLVIFGVEYSGVTGFKAQNSQSSTMTYYRPDGTSAITANGTYNVAAYASASVLVTPTLSTVTGVVPTETAQTISAPSGYDGLSTVTVSAIPAAYIIPTGTSNITSNGVYNISQYASVSVSVSGVGGYTIDQIASRREISGWISGNASDIGSMAFGGTSVTRATFSNASRIQNLAFASCGSLMSVASDDFPACEMIIDYAFHYCTKMTEVHFPHVSQVRSSAFYNCFSLHTIDFPEVESVYMGAFNGCSKLKNVSLPSVVSIGGSAFKGCVSLSEISLPEATVLGQYAFESCLGLINISIPKVASISAQAFRNCTALPSVYGPSVVSIQSDAFPLCSALSEVSFPLLSSVGSSAFRSAYGLTTASIPNAEYLGGYAFASCYSLQTVTTSQVKTINNYAFYCCSELSEISLPALESVGNAAFSACWRLVSVNLTGVSSVPYAGPYLFTSTPISNYSTVAGQYGSIYVPASLYSAFTTAANWSTYSARMVSV